MLAMPPAFTLDHRGAPCGFSIKLRWPARCRLSLTSERPGVLSVNSSLRRWWSSRAMAGRLKVVNVNVDEAQATASRFGVQGIPTLLLSAKAESSIAWQGRVHSPISGAGSKACWLVIPSRCCDPAGSSAWMNFTP